MVAAGKKGRGRRTSRRVPLASMITYRLGGQEYGNLSVDISAEGIFIRTFVPPEVGTAIDIILQLPARLGGGKLELSGEVARVVVDHPDPRQNGMGVRFLSVRSDDPAAVHYLVKTLFTLK
ncbi:MAG: hypothetical protein DRI34_03735 [Deltaproteobacteria bacterium]|nr:MAG: hypothetical protein DRI34_03735 [Deltaproteobacteria bacterium]